MVWKQILPHRAACDRFLKNTDGISFMVSSVTGMVAKSPNPAAGKIVNPGVSYWLVLESSNVDPRVVVRNMQGALQGEAELRLLREPPLITSLDAMENTLCNVMKDHNNSYIKRRISESQPEDTSGGEKGMATRLVGRTVHFAAFAKQAQLAMENGGIYVDVQDY